MFWSVIRQRLLKHGAADCVVTVVSATDPLKRTLGGVLQAGQRASEQHYFLLLNQKPKMTNTSPEAASKHKIMA